MSTETRGTRPGDNRIILWLLFVSPYGLYLMWKHGAFTSRTRKIITAAVVAAFVAYSAADNDRRATPHPAAQTYPAPTQKVEASKAPPKSDRADNQQPQTAQRGEGETSDSAANETVQGPLGNFVFVNRPPSPAMSSILDEMDVLVERGRSMSGLRAGPSPQLGVCVEKMRAYQSDVQAFRDRLGAVESGTAGEYPASVAVGDLNNCVSCLASGDDACRSAAELIGHARAELKLVRGR